MRSVQNPSFFDTHVLPVLRFLTSMTTQLGLILLIALLALPLAYTERPLFRHPLEWLLGAAILVTALSFALNFMGCVMGAAF